MTRLVGFTLGLIVAWLCAVTVAGPALAAPGPDLAPIYDYDGQHHPPAQTDTFSERGPSAIAYDYTAPHLVVDAAPHGSLACPRTATSPTCTDYDHLVQLVRVAGDPDTTLTEAGARESNTRADLRARCAANAGAKVCSFAGATTVLMADGSRKPIEDIRVGDKVIATDPETGEQVAKTVEHVFVHDDTVIDLVVDGEVITTTEDHPFWSVTDQRFERADELSPGEKVLAADGRVITVSGLRLGTGRQALAYNLEVEGIHTFHVGESEILVHNQCVIPSKSNYRDLFTKAHPDMPSNYQVHHALPQKYAETMQRAGVNIHDPSLLRGVDPTIHSRITTAWGRWERGLGRTPTADDITRFSYQIDEMYGSSFVW